MPCSGCSRRELLCAIGATVLAGCGGQDSTGPGVDLPVDAPMGIACGTNRICLDLTQAAFGALANVGGFVRVAVPGDLLIAIRTSDTTIATLSAVCTHESCSMMYTATLMRVTCPCHGSQFALTGQVVRGPAMEPIKVYATSFDAAQNLVTITLA